MIVGAAVHHPLRPELELLAANVPLTGSMIASLSRLGIGELWVRHDALADLDWMVNDRLPALRRQVYATIKRDFAALERDTVSTAQVHQYRQIVMQLVCELMCSRRVAGLTDMLFSADAALFAHGANVAYLATLAGLELESYIISQRAGLPMEHARDLVGLGMGAMLHDVGKVRLPARLRNCHWAGDAPTGADRAVYQRHPQEGYAMLKGSRCPATATQAVLSHHQRHDGQGFPDMSELTRRRQHGPQRGRQIHVFSRIVAAANVLDNLLCDARGCRRPPVAALHDFGSARFDGWFDPVVRQVMLRRLPPFALGSQVKLSDGRVGAVVAPCRSQPCRPTLRLLDESAGGGAPATLVLETAPPEVFIVSCAGTRVDQWLFDVEPLLKIARRPAG